MDMSISRGYAHIGGGISLDGSGFKMTGGTIAENTATVRGGAISLQGGNATISGDTKITENNTDGLGGGIYLGGEIPSDSFGRLTIGGATTISGNTAKSEAPNGKGVYHDGDSLTITSDETNIADDILLSDQFKNSDRDRRVITITTPIKNSHFNLSTRDTDVDDGRIVVKPGETLADASPYAQAFTHNLKGIVPNGKNLVLGSFKISYDINKPSGATSEPSPSKIPSKDIDINKVIPIPNNSSLEGYTFKGWAYDVAGKKAFNKTDNLTKAENVTLYAQWVKNINANNKDNNNPSTGDDSNMIMFLVIMIIALISSGAVYYIKRKKSNISR